MATFDYVGTNANDTIAFSATLQQFTQTLVNPYSGYTITVDEEKNVNNSSYDGAGGTFDLLLMTSMGDVFFYEDENGDPTIQNLELLIAGSSDDIIDLTSETLVLTDTLVSGGGGNDVIWGNAGNDTLDGAAGHDIVDGGPGDDIVTGNNGDDLLFGGDGNDDVRGDLGNDEIYGDDGDDILIGEEGFDIIYGDSGSYADTGTIILDKDFADDVVFPTLVERVDIKNLAPPGTPALGIKDDNLSVDFEATATLTFRKGFAGYNNSLGMYRIAEDGTIEMANLLWENVKDAGINTGHQIDIPVGENGGDYGFFILANGDRKNWGYWGLDDTSEAGNIKFIYDFGGANERAATIHDSGNDVSVVYDDGNKVRELRGHTYHTTARDGSADINDDGKTHAVSGIVQEGDTEVLRIGFEDLYNLGDADFEDVLFEIDINEVEIEGDPVATGNDIIDGGFDDDILYGESGDDIIMGGHGFDDLYGGEGADTFRFRSSDLFDEVGQPIPGETHDTIFDFDSTEGDIIDIADLLTEYDALSSDIADFVIFMDNVDGDTEMYVNDDGVGAELDLVVVFDGGINDTVADLLNSGQLIVA